MSTTCDKCDTAVPETNDAVLFDAIFTGNPVLVLFGGSRHLLPVTDDNGVTICEGSPSRAQYIEGQSPDVRGDYPYNERREAEYRAAYAKLIALEPAAL